MHLVSHCEYLKIVYFVFQKKIVLPQQMNIEIFQIFSTDI